MAKVHNPHLYLVWDQTDAFFLSITDFYYYCQLNAFFKNLFVTLSQAYTEVLHLKLTCVKQHDASCSGLFQKKSTPPRRKAQFFYPPPPIHLNIQNCFSPPPLRISKFKDPPPPPIWISIKLLDTVILLNTQCRRILLGT